MSSIRRCALGAALTLSAALAAGQTAQTAQTAQTGTAGAPELAPVTITGNPLGHADGSAIAAQLSGPDLLLRTQASLGETLAATPGVSSTYFGPNASRPVIRGLDGDRIRILTNSGAAPDASGLSFDHAVSADPIAVERIEVLRGPGALLYGGSAVGGVVNLIDNRIPREPVRRPTGRVDLGWASGAHEHSAAALLEAGGPALGLHVDVSDRRAGDVSVPVDLPCAAGGVNVTKRVICNSAGWARSGAAGASVFFDRGRLGASASSFRSGYGTVAEDDVTIGMRSDRWALDGEWRPAASSWQTLTLQASRTDYRHTEFESGVPGSVFRSAANDLRLQARHAPAAGWSGVVGLQWEGQRFAIDGAEAFSPHSRSAQSAVFVHEERELPWGRASLGARMESVQVESLGHPDIARFATGRRDFQPLSLAASLLWRLTPQWSLDAGWSRTQRAPRDYELFADGPHLATGAWEQGDVTLGLERSLNLDLGLQWKSGPHSARLSVFDNRFADYVSLQATGQRSVDGSDLPVLAYRAVPARLHGFEASGTRRLWDSTSRLDLDWRLDAVRATRTDTGEPLPRIAPMRGGATLAWTSGRLALRLGFDRAASQQRVPSGDRPTAGYTLWNAALTWRSEFDAGDLLWFARLDNLGDTRAESASSILTQTAPGRAPLPGRSLRLGVRATF